MAELLSSLTFNIETNSFKSTVLRVNYYISKLIFPKGVGERGAEPVEAAEMLAANLTLTFMCDF